MYPGLPNGQGTVDCMERKRTKKNVKNTETVSIEIPGTSEENLEQSKYGTCVQNGI